MRWLIVGVAVLAGLVAPERRAQAGVLFFVDDMAGFQSATSSLGLLGSEDWASGSGVLQVVDEPLLPGIALGPFPNGVTPSLGMSVQSNTLGSAGTTLSPGGKLAFAPTGFVGNSGNVQPSDQLSSTRNGDGFDLIFGNGAVAEPVAVSLSPMFYRTTGTSNSGTITVRAFNAANAEIGSTTVPNVLDVLETSFIGVVATPPDMIGRLNLWAAADAVAGADNINVLPEPSTLAAALMAFATLATLHRWGRSSNA